MKIATLSVATTAFLHLKGPDGSFLYDEATKEPVGIDLFGPGSRESVQVESQKSARMVKRMADNGNKVSLPSIEEQRKEDTQDLVAVTAGFRHIEHDDASGQPLAGNSLYHAVYSEPSLGWIKPQIDKFQADWGKFSVGPKPT